MESTQPSPPPYQQNHPNTEEVILKFDNLQHYIHDHNHTLISHPDYQTFDNNWNTAKILGGNYERL